MKLQAVIFDVDGTLADTEEAHRQAFNDAFKESGLPWHWDAELYAELLAVAGGKERLRHYCRSVDSARLRAADADDFIARLHARKTRIYTRRVDGGEVPAKKPRPKSPHRTFIVGCLASSTYPATIASPSRIRKMACAPRALPASRCW